MEQKDGLKTIANVILSLLARQTLSPFPMAPLRTIRTPSTTYQELVGSSTMAIQSVSAYSVMSVTSLYWDSTATNFNAKFGYRKWVSN